MPNGLQRRITIKSSEPVLRSILSQDMYMDIHGQSLSNTPAHKNVLLRLINTIVP